MSPTEIALAILAEAESMHEHGLRNADDISPVDRAGNGLRQAWLSGAPTPKDLMPGLRAALADPRWLDAWGRPTDSELVGLVLLVARIDRHAPATAAVAVEVEVEDEAKRSAPPKRKAPAAQGKGAAGTAAPAAESGAGGYQPKVDGSDWHVLLMQCGGKGAPHGESHRALLRRIRHWLSNRGIVADGMYGFTQHGVTISKGDVGLSLDCWIELLEAGPIGRDHVRALFEHVVDDLREQRRQTVIAQLCGAVDRQAGSDALDRLVVVVTGRPATDPDFALHRAVLRHAMWQVKRLMSGRDSEHEMMVVFTGAQGAGKSTVMRDLLAPLAEFCIGVSHTSLSDDRYQASLGRAFAAIWDELAGASKAEVQKIKHSITAKHFDPRQFFSANLMKVRRTVTFFGASNDPLQESIQDPTGMRRFWEIVSPAKYDWDALKQIDMAKVWQSVHQDDPCPLLEGDLLARIRAVQDRLKPQDAINQWIEAECADGWPEIVVRLASRMEPLRLESMDWTRGRRLDWYMARLQAYAEVGKGVAGMSFDRLRKRLRQEGCLCKRWGPESNRGPEHLVPPVAWRPASVPSGAVADSVAEDFA